MPDTINNQIQARVEAFTDELTHLIREAAMEAVREALGAGSAKTARAATPGAKQRATKKRSTKASGTQQRSTKKKAGRPRGQSAARVDKLSAAVVRALQSEASQSISDLAAGIGVSSADLKRPIADLLESGEITKTGQKRGTRYNAA